MNDIYEVLRAQGTWTALKINIKKSKLLRLGISKSEEVMLGDKKINQVDSFTYLGSIKSKDGGCSEDANRRILAFQQ